ncbi:MAG TPA: hypothetical protein VFN85_04490 [Solirubrobacterales bacterium]|nr:hypothetical protein [Solirubrobacterales bacterium]
MPVELSPTAVARALARLGEHDLEAPGDVEAALELIAGREDDDAPLEVSRYRLQLFLWYQLPCKLLAPLAVMREVAGRLGRFLELFGEDAETYARLCTSEETMAMLEAWEEDDPAADERLREALVASGLEPPDTEVLAWRPVMGFEEARLRDQVALELERWIEREHVDTGARGFKRRQADLVAEFLRQPASELGGLAPLGVVVAERIEHWARGGSEARAELIAPVLPMLRGPTAEEEEMCESMEPLAWLLERAAEGIGLTQTGALNRDLVQRSVERFPAWWSAERPQREEDVASLCEVHELARRMRLLRRSARRAVLTARGKALLGDRRGLRDAAAPHLIAAEGFSGAVQELTVAVLLAGPERGSLDDLVARVHAAIVAEGWNAAGQAPAALDVRACAWEVLRPAQALGLLVHEYEYDRERRRARDELTLSAAGREALRLALRARAAG